MNLLALLDENLINLSNGLLSSYREKIHKFSSHQDLSSINFVELLNSQGNLHVGRQIKSINFQVCSNWSLHSKTHMDSKWDLSGVVISKLWLNLWMSWVSLQVLGSWQFSYSLNSRDECFVSDLGSHSFDICLTKIFEFINLIFNPWSIWPDCLELLDWHYWLILLCSFIFRRFQVSRVSFDNICFVW